jgi:hypothetical protein
VRLPVTYISVLLAAGVVLGQYSGTYTIMPSGGDFASHAEAADSLMTYGVTGPCTLLVYTGTYNGQARFDSPDWDSVEVVFLAAPGESPAVESWFIYFTDNITVDGIATTSGRAYYYISNSHHCQVRNQAITSPDYGVRQSGSNATIFENCDIVAGTDGLYLDHSDSVRVIGCRIRAGHYGLRMDYSRRRYIVGNSITAGSRYGIYAECDSASYSCYDTIANNLASGTRYGIYHQNHRYSYIVCNTFYGAMYGCYDYGGHNSTNYNNIFYGDGSYAIYRDSSSTVSNSDYNCMWSSGSYVVYYNRGLTMADWRGLGFDSTGINRDPMVGGQSNLHLRRGSPCIDSGLAIAGFLLDVDGDTIHNGVRDIGADEYTGVGRRMAGKYLIHQDPDSGDYSSLIEACSELALRGTAAACTFDVAAGIYHEQILVDNVPGGHPVVFQARGYGSSGKEDVTIRSSSYPVKLTGSEYVTIQGFSAITTSSTTYGIWMARGCERCVIRDNRISAYYGLYMSSACHCSIIGTQFLGSGSYAVYGSNSDANVFINNMFAGAGYGMYMYDHDSTRLLYNSIAGRYRGFWDVYGYNETMYNNILWCQSYFGWYKDRGNDLPTASDYNCIYGGNDPTVVYHSTYGEITLAEWQSYSGMDSNSIARSPVTRSWTDLHLKATSPCRDSALPMRGILKDVDGDSRDLTPCIGCDEWRNPGRPMRGVYYVHPNPDSGDYVSFLEAWEDICARGFGDDITLRAYSGTYEGDLDLGDVGNTVGSDTFKFTIEAVEGQTPVIQGSGGDTPAVNLVSAKNVKIEGLTMNGYYGLSMFHTGNDSGCLNCSIIGNNINGTFSPAIISRGCHNVLAGNTITTSGYYGSGWYGESTSCTFNNLVYNNMVISTHPNGLGLRLDGHRDLLVAHNSFYGSFHCGLLVVRCSSLAAKGNIVHNVADSPSYYCVADVDNTASEWDYNCLWGPDCSVARKDDSLLDWAGWQTAGRDSHGINADPYYSSSTDLHLTDSSPCIDVCTPIPGITVDFDGDLRDSTPDIGADEWVGTGMAEGVGKPLVVGLFRAAPNPASGPVRIRWQVPTLSRVSLKAYNIMGQCVSTLVDRVVEPGVYVTVWHARDNHGRRLAPGVYFYTLETGDTKLTRKVVIQR